MKDSVLKEMRRAARNGRAVSRSVALAILKAGPADIPEIMACANAMRLRHFGNKIHLCSILNAKSGACSEDCAFCAQSVRHKTRTKVYGLLAGNRMVAAKEEAAKLPIDHFGIVTSGAALDDKGVERICEAIKSRKNSRVAWCASLGIINEDQLRALKQAGLKRFHHNLETARSFFPSICSTHTFEERLQALRLVKKTGLETCCGGILGMGETLEQRVEFAEILEREKVDSIPLNFLVPIAGTCLEKCKPMKPLEILKSIAMFRMLNPRAEIKVCAGRPHLRDLQSMIFYAGATGMMIGDLLTVAGRDVPRDLQMLKDLERGGVFG
jgi:biotin synthase